MADETPASRPNGLIPNTFQTPNLLIDRALPLLEPPEFVILMFIVRHTLGWKDRLETKRAAFTLSDFENGFRGFPGCGLSRPTIVKMLANLVDCNLITKIDEPDPNNEGQIYAPVLDEHAVRWSLLEQRRWVKQQANRKRTAKGRTSLKEKRAAAVNPINPPGVNAINQPAVNPINQNAVSGINQEPVNPINHVYINTDIETQIETQKAKDSDASPDGSHQATATASESRVLTLQQQLFGVFQTFYQMAPDAEVLADSQIGRCASWLAGNAVKRSRKKDAELVPGCSPPATPDEVRDFLREWCQIRGLILSPDMLTFSDNFIAMRPELKRAAPAPTRTAPAHEELTQEERKRQFDQAMARHDALLARAQTVRRRLVDQERQADSTTESQEVTHAHPSV